MTKETGGPAFPTTKPLESWNDPNQGMALRDYFAAAVLQGMCAGLERGDNPDAIPEFAYTLADAMLEARK